jgi:hypothetical protein
MPDDTNFGASRALLGAALGGLLCIATATCTSSDGGNATDGAGGASSSSATTEGVTSTTASSTTGGHATASASVGGTGGSTASAGGGGTGGSTASAGGGGAGTGGSSASAGGATVGVGGAGGGTTASAGGAPVNGDTPIPNTGCPDGVSPTPEVTSTVVGPVTQQEFEDMCSARHGIFEIQPGCGGSNAGRGFSYDSGTQKLTEHTCRATNTCAGYSCVICDP